MGAILGICFGRMIGGVPHVKGHRWMSPGSHVVCCQWILFVYRPGRDLVGSFIDMKQVSLVIAGRLLIDGHTLGQRGTAR